MGIVGKEIGGQAFFGSSNQSSPRVIIRGLKRELNLLIEISALSSLETIESETEAESW
jgi:hypothetical protein